MALTEEQLRKLDEMATSGDSGVRTLLSSAGDQIKEIDLLGVKLRVLATIPRKLRHELTKFESLQNDLEGTEKHMYFIMSQICVDSPFNNAEMWEYIDEKKGIVPDLMREAFNLAYDIEQKIKRFR